MRTSFGKYNIHLLGDMSTIQEMRSFTCFFEISAWFEWNEFKRGNLKIAPVRKNKRVEDYGHISILCDKRIIMWPKTQGEYEPSISIHFRYSVNNLLITIFIAL